MSYIVSVDVGIKNLALCAYDFCTNQVIHWENVSLVPNGRYVPAQNVQYVRDFVLKHEALFGSAAVILVERQMRCNMRIIEAVLQTMYFDRTLVISPKSIKAHYNLSTRNYRQNKVKAVEWAQEFIKNNGESVFAPDVTRTFEASKKDDLADSLLICMFYLDTYSTQLD